MRRTRDNRKLDRIHTPLGIDHLEARMLCAIDTALDQLMSLNAAPGFVGFVGASSSQVARNAAPTLAKPVSLSSPTQTIVKSVALTALGRDDRGEGSLVYRWSVTPVTAGTSGTFSVNASNAAKNTTLTFTRSGEYYVRVTITDNGGLSVNNSLRINVNQIFTSIYVTPGTSNVAAGKTQQFSARALDQFQQPLTRQPVFTWSASSGAINQSGLFTAPSAAANATINVRSGLLSASVRVTVTASTPAPTNPTQIVGLQNAALSSLVSTYYADGSLNRTDIIQLLRSAGSDGKVDATELNDFRYIVTNATQYKIPGYVLVLASNIVNTNPANGFYQGQTAGNLAAGSSSTLLNNLVDKWFLGSDLPTLTSSLLSYQIVAGSLFNGTPSGNNMKQGMLGDCYLIASLGAVADRNPSAVSNMFIDNGDGTFTVRFYTGSYGSFYNTDGTISDGFRSGTGLADYVTVNRRLPAYSNGTLAYSGMGSRVSDAANSLWIALAEKAYAQWNATGKSGRNGTNSYASIEGGWMGTVNAQILGYNATDYYLDAKGQQALISALGTGKAVTIGTKSGATEGGLVGGHAYTLVGYSTATQTFSLANPWGTAHPSPLTWAQLQTNCSMFVVANTSGTAPIVASGSTPSVRGSSDAASFVDIATFSSNTYDLLRSDATNTTLQPEANRELSSADFSSSDVEHAFEFGEFAVEDFTVDQSHDQSPADTVDHVLASLIDAILNIENLNPKVFDSALHRLNS